MEINTPEQLKPEWDLIPPHTKKAFEFLSTQKWISESGWYLAGGTALALQTNNRKSVDLDFFTTEKGFDVKKLLSNFSEYSDWLVTTEENNTLYGELLKAKVSFIAYPFFVPKMEYLQYGSIKIIQPRDIAVMKIVAISQRGKKRDFFDLYWCAHNIESLEQIIRRLPEQYPSVAHDYHHILKALVYFEDAESDPDPEINFDADWSKVKDFFQKEIPRIVNILV